MKRMRRGNALPQAVALKPGEWHELLPVEGWEPLYV
jgi:hypothetical protein